MTVQFKPIKNIELFHAVTGFYQSGDSLSVDYKIGTLKDGEFDPLVEKNFWIDNAQDLINKPLSNDDLGKTYNEVMLSRIEDYLRSEGEIKL